MIILAAIKITPNSNTIINTKYLFNYGHMTPVTYAHKTVHGYYYKCIDNI